MIRRGLIVLVVVLVGHLLVGSLSWALLNVPESSVWMLMLSATLLVLILVVIGLTETTALLTLTPDLGLRGAAARAWTAWPFIVPALVVIGAGWWASTSLDASWTRHAGEIDAWLMFRFGWTDTSWLHRAVDILLVLVRWVIGPSMGLALLASGARGGVRAIARWTWIRAALSRRQLGSLGLAWLVLVVLPLKAIYWRPDTWPPIALEPFFVAAKLGLILLATHVGWTVALHETARSTTD